MSFLGPLQCHIPCMMQLIPCGVFTSVLCYCYMSVTLSHDSIPSGSHSDAPYKVSNNVPFLEVLLYSFTKSCLFPIEEPILGNHGAIELAHDVDGPLSNAMRMDAVPENNDQLAHVTLRKTIRILWQDGDGASNRCPLHHLIVGEVIDHLMKGIRGVVLPGRN